MAVSLDFLIYIYTHKYTHKGHTEKTETIMTSKLPTVDELLNCATEKFEEIFRAKPDIISCAPGRVNLVGDHVDYNDGFVLPMVRVIN